MLSALFMNTSGLKAFHIIAQGIALRVFVGGEVKVARHQKIFLGFLWKTYYFIKQ